MLVCRLHHLPYLTHKHQQTFNLWAGDTLTGTVSSGAERSRLLPLQHGRDPRFQGKWVDIGVIGTSL